MKVNDLIPHDELINLAIMIAIISVLVLFLSPVMAELPSGGIEGAVIVFVLLIVFLYLGHKVGFPDFKEFVTLFLAASAYGTILGTFLPDLSGYIIAAPQFTVTAIAWTMVYIGLAKVVRKMTKL